MTTPANRSPIKRRSLFKATGIGTAGAAGLPLAAGCGDVSGGEGNVQELDQTLDILPEYKEWPLPAQPDLIGEPPHHPSAFLSFPDPVPQAIPNPPSNSGTYQVYVPDWGPAMSKDDPYFDAMQEAAGGTRMEFVQNPAGTYGDAAVQWIRAEEFGDAIFLQAYMSGADANFNETVINRFANLTDHLSGDISERWPLLADRGDDAGRWAVSGTDWMPPAWFGLTAGSGWMWDGSGMVHNFERPEYKDYVEFHRTLTDGQLRHPGVGTADFDHRAAQRSGEVVFDQDGWNRWPELTAEVRTTGENPDFEYDADGKPAFTEAGNLSKQDSFAYTAMSGVTQVFIGGPADVVEARFAFDEAMQPYLDENLFKGLRLTAPEAGGNATTVFNEKVQNIIYGRAELSEFDAAVETWKAEGAEESREFYEQAYRQLHGE
ncbi:hypothetical protein [Glycomyces tenuis]|uniref:hypothetical protein n=1 Tax=Glycomyces tenuis TaxID=58116 RepID=UPI0003FBFDAF|nr:hypothetical protein [Glycomyces tenuis]